MKKTDYEIQMISRIIADRQEYFNNANLLHEALFIKHAEIFGHVTAQYQKGIIPSHENLMSVFSQKQDTILDIITSLDYSIPTELVIQELHEKYRNHTINNACIKVGLAKSSEEKVSILTEMLTNLEKFEVKKEIFHVYEVAQEVIEKLKSGVNTGIKTDFAEFDRHTGGLQPSDLIIIGARSSQGKTSLALTMNANLARMGRKTLFISMELSKPQLTIRHMAGIVNISPKAAAYQVEPFSVAADHTRTSQFYMADVTNTNYRNIMGLIRSAVIRHGIEVAFIDYLQLMRSDSHTNKREQEVGTIARAFKNLAKELNIPIVLLSQLSRDEGKNPEPRLDSLRDSGQIEEAADIVWLIYRPDHYRIEEYTYYKGERQITTGTTNRAFHHIAKGRNYGTTIFETGFNPKVAKFTETNFVELNQTTIPEHSPGDHHQQSGIHQDNDTGNEEQPF